MTWSEIIETVEPDSVISTVDCSPENMKRREEDAILKAINYNIQLLPHSGKDNSSFYADLPLEELLRIDAEKAKSDAVITCVRAETFREKENMLSQAKTAHQALGMDVNSAFHANHLVGKSFKKFAQLSKKLYAMIFERSTMQSLDLHNLHKKEAIFAVECFLERLRILCPSLSTKEVKIITGQGNFSVKGPVLKPAIKQYLESRNIAYTSKAGCILIEMKSITENL